MALLEVKVTPELYELHRVTDLGSELLTRLSSGEEGARMLLLRLHQYLDAGADGSGVALAGASDREAALLLIAAIESDHNASGPLSALAVELAHAVLRMPEE